MKVESRHPWKFTMLPHSPGMVRITRDMAIAPNKLLKYSRLSGTEGARDQPRDRSNRQKQCDKNTGHRDTK